MNSLNFLPKKILEFHFSILCLSSLIPNPSEGEAECNMMQSCWFFNYLLQNSSRLLLKMEAYKALFLQRHK